MHVLAMSLETFHYCLESALSCIGILVTLQGRKHRICFGCSTNLQETIIAQCIYLEKILACLEYIIYCINFVEGIGFFFCYYVPCHVQ